MGEDVNDLLATRRAYGDALAALQAENARLAALLESHGIEWRTLPSAEPQPPPPSPVPGQEVESQRSDLSTAEKVALFRRLLRGGTDVYPVRWGSKTSGKSGYAPACVNEWRAGVCEKPRIKCGDSGHRLAHAALALVPELPAGLYRPPASRVHRGRA